jgi:hypothetical protein
MYITRTSLTDFESPFGTMTVIKKNGQLGGAFPLYEEEECVFGR